MLFFYLIKQDLALAMRQRQELMQPIVFFVVLVSLFPLAIAVDNDFLSQLAPAIIWIAALLVTVIFMENLFRNDFMDGSLEKVILSPQPLLLTVLAKIFSHWLMTGLLLIICTPLLAIALHMSLQPLKILLFSLLLGTPILSVIGAIATALTLGLRQSGILISLICLPLYVPVLIFGAAAVSHSMQHLPVGMELTMLAALLVLALTLGPLAVAGSLKISVNY